MLTAGYDERAARWGNIVGAMDDGEADGAWALLAVASERPAVDLGFGRIEAFTDRDDSEDGLRSKVLLAALAGLDRMGANDQYRLANALGVQPDAETAWTQIGRESGRGRVCLSV